jgi:hypothetical protein
MLDSDIPETCYQQSFFYPGMERTSTMWKHMIGLGALTTSFWSAPALAQADEAPTAKVDVLSPIDFSAMCKPFIDGHNQKYFIVAQQPKSDGRGLLAQCRNGQFPFWCPSDTEARIEDPGFTWQDGGSSEAVARWQVTVNHPSIVQVRLFGHCQ